jgi:uncharacterized membrane protein
VALLRSRLLQVLLPGLLSAGLILATALAYPLLTLGLVAVSVAMFWAALWSASVLLGHRGARVLAVLALGLGWFAEQMGSSRGWFFGRYTYTEVLGPRLGDVPLAIPLMWLALCLVGYVLASLILWRTPVHAAPTLNSGALTAWLAAMIVTTFDLGADPYFVYVLKAWIMEKPDGGWFGETLQGFVGWMLVSFVIVATFQALAAPRRVPAIKRQTRLAAWVPIGLYASGLVFQVFLGHPVEIRAIAFFAMGMPTLIAWVAWRHWTLAHAEAPQAQPAHSVPLDPMGLQADPLADRTVAALIGPWSGADGATGPATDRLAAATRLMAGWTSNGALADWGPGDPAAVAADPAVVAALRAYVGEGRALPAWADAAKVERAEAIFMEQGPLSCTLLFCASLPECYVLPNLAEVLHIAGQLEQHTEHRIRQTAAMVFPVMMKGGLMDASGAGVAQVLKVRLIHATIRHLILRGEPQAVRGQVAPLLRAGASTGMHAALMSHGWDVDRQGLPCNQIELAYTLLTFSYSFLKGMRTLGLGLPRADEEAYLHAWNVMGHVLGVRRELMADTMEEAAALFERIQAQAHGQSVSPDARPALGRALMQTMERTIRLPVVRGIPVPLTRWLIGPDTAREIGVDERVSWPTRLLFLAGRLLVRLIDTVVRVFSPGFSLSRLFTRIVGYHLLTRFLLDQTRPLNLPDHLLNPLTETVSAWSDDPAAPGWLNRLEDRWTTTGHWRPVHGGGTAQRPVPEPDAVVS